MLSLISCGSFTFALVLKVMAARKRVVKKYLFMIDSMTLINMSEGNHYLSFSDFLRKGFHITREKNVLTKVENCFDPG